LDHLQIAILMAVVGLAAVAVRIWWRERRPLSPKTSVKLHETAVDPKDCRNLRVLYTAKLAIPTIPPEYQDQYQVRIWYHDPPGSHSPIVAEIDWDGQTRLDFRKGLCVFILQADRIDYCRQRSPLYKYEGDWIKRLELMARPTCQDDTKPALIHRFTFSPVQSYDLPGELEELVSWTRERGSSSSPLEETDRQTLMHGLDRIKTSLGID